MSARLVVVAAVGSISTAPSHTSESVSEFHLQMSGDHRRPMAPDQKIEYAREDISSPGAMEVHWGHRSYPTLSRFDTATRCSVEDSGAGAL
ncbi:hypothetical protein BD311DRAFT_763616, partial [Dichomitus squalens]